MAKANASGGGLLLGLRGTDVNAVSRPKTGTSIRDGATLEATEGDITITSQSAAQASATGTGKSGATIGVGLIWSNADLTNCNTASVGEDVQIHADGSFTLLADSSNTADAHGTGGSGGLVDISRAETAVSIDDIENGYKNETATRIGNASEITAGDILTVQARMETTADTHSDVDTWGLGVNAATCATMTFIGSTEATIGDATLKAKRVHVLAEVTSLNIGGVDTDIEVDADSVATAVGTDSDATAIVTTTTTADVTIGDASITGPDQVEIVARHTTEDGLICAGQDERSGGRFRCVRLQYADS